MLDADRCRRILSQSFPELDARAVRYFAQGWDYELWEVNGDLLFRFPLRREAVAPLRKEARLLAALADALSVPVPRPQYLSDGCAEFPLPFLGYRRLPGIPLDVAALGERQQKAMARELGRFLSGLHRFPAARAVELGVPYCSPEGWRRRYRDFREEIDRDVLPLLTPRERSAVEEFWRRFLEDERHFRFEPVLIHGDLGLEHVLADPERTAITGVIDFGDAVVGDPALDFAGLEGAFQRAVLACYEPAGDHTLLSRAACYRKLGPFHEILYGLQIQKQRHIEAGLAGIRRRIVRRE